MSVITNGLRYMIVLAMALLTLPFLHGADCRAADADDGDSKEHKIKSLKSVSEECTAYPGLFTMFQHPTSGKVYLLVKKEQLGQEFIHFSYIEDGVVDAGHFRGNYRGARVFSIERYFDRLDFYLENTSFYFDRESPLHRAASANINRPLLCSKKIHAANDDESEWLIEAEDLFLKESWQQIKSSMPGDQASKRFALGELSKDKNKIAAISSYPLNTDVVGQYVYEKKYPLHGGHSAVTDARFVSVTIRHSLIAMPRNDYQPRYDDPRVGYFTRQITDMTSTDATPYRDVIHRWHLKKKDPSAAISEPVEPITWWIENTTPHEVRATLRDAALAWNFAFEAAGFRNAIQVNIQPDDAEWDAGDIRYNVLRWTSSPVPPFGGYGPSFVNPRSGQILGADIMLEFVWITNRLRTEKIFASSLIDVYNEAHGDCEHHCSLGAYLHMENLFGRYVLSAFDALPAERSEMLRQSLYFLVLHEIGHTLGLNHNFKASTLHSPAKVKDRALAELVGLSGSVMDYLPPNIAPVGEKQGLYHSTRPGPYDVWAIEFGYSSALEDAAAEEQRLQRILARSTEAQLAFGNDADDMRSPGRGIDPAIMIGDLTSDAIAYTEERLQLISQTYPKLRSRLSKEYQSYHELRNAYLILTGIHANAARIVSRYIGGLRLDRSFATQTGGAGQPFLPVASEQQQRAMKVLRDHVFNAQAFTAAENLYAFLQAQRRGFSHYGQTEDPKIHARILTMQRDVFDHLLHPTVMQRIIDTELYGNSYRLNDMLTDLSDAIFRTSDPEPQTLTFNLQLEYVRRLSAILQSKADSGYSHLAQSSALYELKRIRKEMTSRAYRDAAGKAHREHVLYRIEQALDNQLKD